MLYVTLGKVRAGTRKERTARRLQWSYPPGMKVIGEYWLQADDPNIVVISEADDIGPMMAALSDWDDLLYWTVVPAVTAEAGMEMAKKMMA
jgi:hypothetical protein